MKAAPANSGERGADSLPFSQSGTLAQALNLKVEGIDFVFGYLGVINTERVGHLLDAQLAVSFVTLGNQLDGAKSVQHLQALAAPEGVTVYLDIEGQRAMSMPPKDLTNQITIWAGAIEKAGFQPGIYLGSPQPFTSGEMWSLPVKSYWKGFGACRDRFGALAEPLHCGWSIVQCYPSVTRAGVLVDLDFVTEDYLRRVPILGVKS